MKCAASFEGHLLLFAYLACFITVNDNISIQAWGRMKPLHLGILVTWL